MVGWSLQFSAVNCFGKKVYLRTLTKTQLRTLRHLNTKINRLHERCLRIVYNDKKWNFNDLLVRGGFVSIHHQNLQKLAVEMFNVSRGLSPENINELFQFREQISYELRQRPQFQIPWIHSAFSGTESLKFVGPKVWALVPNEWNS